MATVLTVGETMGLAVTAAGTPMRTADTARLHTAGAESTVAIGLARLGVDSAWIGVVGADPIGERVLRDLRAEGVGTAFARIHSSARTGFMLRELRAGEHARVAYYRDGSAGSMVGPADVDAACDAGAPALVHVSGITAALSESGAEAVLRLVERARRAGAAVSLDVNYRATMPRRAEAARLLGGLLGDVDVLFVGDDELHVLTSTDDVEAAGQQLAARGPGEVVIKRGAAGATCLADGRAHAVPARSVAVRDLIGAGDSFVAGYLAARVLGHDVPRRLEWGTLCAAATVGSDGDWEGLPTRAELDRLAGPPTTER